MYKKRLTRRKGTTSLQSLAKQVKTLQKKTKLITERDQYVTVDAMDTVSPYVVRNLCNYNAWTKLWTSTGTGIQGIRSSMYHRYLTIDNLVTLDNTNNEEGTINFTYFIVSRRDTAGTATDTGTALSLTADVDYSNYNGRTFMNLKKYKVHFCKRFTLTGGDGADMQADNCQRRFTAHVKVGKKIVNPDGHWQTLSNSPDPSDTYYALLFNDNFIGDLEEPRWSFSCLHSIDN